MTQPQSWDLSTRETSTEALVPQRARTDLSERALRLGELPRPVPIDQESARWWDFLASLHEQEGTGRVSNEQRLTVLDVWQRANAIAPSLRRPAVGASIEGMLVASWSFDDLPGKVFSIEIHSDGTIEWFFRDTDAGIVAGTDEPVDALPEAAFAHLTRTFSA